MNDVSRMENKGAAAEACREEATPRSRVDETPQAFVVRIELPGVPGPAIDLSLEDRTLSVTAENAPGSYPGRELVLNEIPAVRYRVSFGLPERVDEAAVKASLKQGVLTLTLPKREESRPRRIAISAE